MDRQKRRGQWDHRDWDGNKAATVGQKRNKKWGFPLELLRSLLPDFGFLEAGTERTH